jgi:drug/metabolite transporter (DMT)-like permease
MGLGESLSLASALMWAFGVILYRRLGETLSPTALNFLKNLLVLGMVLPTVLLLHGFRLPAMDALTVAVCVLSGMLGIAVADTLYFRALNTLGAGRTGIIGNFYSPFVILLSYIFLAERLAPVQIAGFALVSFGVLLVSQRDQGGPLPDRVQLMGVLTGMLAVFLMAAAIVMVKRILEAHALLWVVLLRLLGGILGMLLLFALRRRWPEFRPGGAAIQWGWLLLAAFLGQYLSMILWLGGYKYTQASVAAILNETASVFIVVLAWLILGEAMHRRKLAGVVISMLGVGCMLAG